MSWAGIASNQTVSCNNLQDAVNNGVFTLKNAIPATNEQITKADANNYVNINTSYAPYAAKASNQLVVKSDLQAAAVGYPFTIWYDQPCYWDGFFVEGGAPTDVDACNLNTNSIVLYGNASTLANGMRLYYDVGLTNAWYGNQGGCGNFYRHDADSFMYTDASATVQSLGPCCVSPLTISAQYNGIADMQMVFALFTASSNYIQVNFNWCTDSGAFGNAVLSINAGNTGTFVTFNIDLSRTGFTSSAYSWGSLEVWVNGASSGVVTEMYVQTSSIIVTGIPATCLNYQPGC